MIAKGLRDMPRIGDQPVLWGGRHADHIPQTILCVRGTDEEITVPTPYFRGADLLPLGARADVELTAGGGVRSLRRH